MPTPFIAVGIGIGIGIGVLTFFAEKSYPKAVLASVLATGGCTVGLHSLIEPPEREGR
ncbi:hypothetical protein AB0D40_41430 [Streptomyces massasporeus]|uniref:hypothetical protein n=1 Tax=Streptomyces massasporeus TaxID=67324 RepID=UPI0033DD8B72